MNTIIGIDYSIKSPAITVLYNNEMIHYCFPRVDNIKDKYIKDLEEAGVVVNIISNTERVKNLQISERIKSIDADVLSTLICNTISKFINNNTIIAIEGPAFNAPGNSKLDHIGYTYVLKYALHNKLKILYKNIFVYAPTSVKQTAGKGNFKKSEVIQSFIDSNLREFKTSKLKEFLNNPKTIDNFLTPKSKDFKKPLDDIIDSAWVLMTYIVKTKN